MKLNILVLKEAGWAPPTVPARAGPEHLAQLVRYAWEFKWTAFGNPPESRSLSKAFFDEVVERAYYASLMPEEGVYLHYGLITLADGDQRWMARFDQPAALDSESAIKKLGAACSGDAGALVVREIDGHPCAVGLASLTAVGYDIQSARPEVVPVGGAPGLCVRVLGPGWITASVAPGGEFELRGGQLRQLVSFTTSRVIFSFCRAAASTAYSEVVKLSPTAQDAFGGHCNIADQLRHALDSIVFRALDRGVGGCLLILPSRAVDASAFTVRLGTKVERLSLRSTMVDLWLAAVAVWATQDLNENRNRIDRLRRVRARLVATIDAIAALTAADGCVTLNSDFDILGFGGEITTKDPDVLACGHPFRDAATLVDTPVQDVLGDRSFGGTRHRSALRFCAAHPGAGAIVISHDRNLRLFHSDNEAVYGFEGLTATHWL